MFEHWSVSRKNLLAVSLCVCHERCHCFHTLLLRTEEEPLQSSVCGAQDMRPCLTRGLPLHTPQEVLDAALAADTATLVDMGFSRSKAREALLSCGRDVQAACEWLFANCT
eukprot:365702-Chlamydomonas_euryale.AAC.23